ncbi:helix-turn-helix domain-containing protein [Desulfofundulus thermosubterraneus]|uniref:helix-turn-helix domain-containing protein n=1 Tax=Desulfofundulus thermosubterraneus TaxID=348840 RepID=UPI000933B193|nr:helix-turn-helix domain-containing protein [Desulfofundulus thermosubterraneus]
MDIGNVLREARQARGVSLEQVEEETKIRRKYLEALEEEAFDVLPGRVYVRGFLRNYARFLGLDAEALVARFEEMLPLEETQPVTQPLAGVEKKLRLGWPFGRLAYVATGLLLAVLLLWGSGWLFGLTRHTAYDDQGRGQPGVSQDRHAGTPDRSFPENSGHTQNAPTSTGTENRSPEGIHLVLNVTDETCWMRVVVDGKTMFTGEVAANQSKSFQAKEHIWVKLGNAGVVNVRVNGRDLGVLGDRGQVVSREFSASTQG